MKALSLTQPWAEMILTEGKRIENRTLWRGCSYRGPVLLHAAKGVGTFADFDEMIERILKILNPPLASTAKRMKPWAVPDESSKFRRWKPAETLRRGGIIGRARIIDVVKDEADFADLEKNVPWMTMQRRWWFGGFALVLDEVEPLPFVPWKGALGLFEVPDDVIKPSRGVAGDRCESGNECGRVGCPECQA